MKLSYYVSSILLFLEGNLTHVCARVGLQTCPHPPLIGWDMIAGVISQVTDQPDGVGMGIEEVSDPSHCITEAAVNPAPSSYPQTNHSTDGAEWRCIKEAEECLCCLMERRRERQRVCAVIWKDLSHNTAFGEALYHYHLRRKKLDRDWAFCNANVSAAQRMESE